MRLNRNQREKIADFYINFAVAWISFGLISPLFIGIKNFSEFILKLLLAIFMTILSLSFSLSFLR